MLVNAGVGGKVVNLGHLKHFRWIFAGFASDCWLMRIFTSNCDLFFFSSRSSS